VAAREDVLTNRLSPSLVNTCNPLLQAHPPWAQDNTSRGSLFSPLCSISRRPIWTRTRSDNLLVGPGTPRQGRPWGVAAGATAPGPTKVVGPHPIKIIPHMVRYLQPAPPENLFACSAKPVRLPCSADGCSSARRPPPPGACSPAAWTAGRLIGDRPGASSPAAWTAGRLISDRRSPTRLRAESPAACQPVRRIWRW
jgi:hypothetical protein